MSKRTFFTLAAMLLAPLAALPAADVTNLRCEYLNNPLGIDVPKPRLSWEIVISDQRGVRETVYQVLVASTPELLAKDKGDLWDSGKVEVAAIAFLSPRKDKPNNINIWFEEMKVPPFSEEQLRQWASDISLLSAEWQVRQDPNRNAEDPEAGKFKWDDKFVANPALVGTWTTVAVVPAMEAFDPAKPVGVNQAPFKEITFKDGGKTDDALRLWTGDILLDLGSRIYAPLQALKMAGKGDHLFIEAGGFSDKNPVGWKSPLVVLKRKAN